MPALMLGLTSGNGSSLRACLRSVVLKSGGRGDKAADCDETYTLLLTRLGGKSGGQIGEAGHPSVYKSVPCLNTGMAKAVHQEWRATLGPGAIRYTIKLRRYV